MAFDFGIFMGQALTAMYPNVFFLAFMCVAIVTTILILIRSPASFTIMVAFVTFALIAGGTIMSGITGTFSTVLLDIPNFLPFLILVIVIIGGAIGYALWRMLGY